MYSLLNLQSQQLTGGSGDDGAYSSDYLSGRIISIDKPEGLTSFGVIRRIKRAAGIKKVGHAGTLDPFASGILIVGIGRTATRRMSEFQVMEKEYIGRVVLGVETDSYDLTGEVVSRKEYTGIKLGELREILKSFRGDILQTPPRFSALKVNGRRLYKAARRGLDFEVEPRRVEIRDIDVLRLMPDGFEVKVTCSKGTYIRSIAHDVGKMTGFGGHLSNLVRTRIGMFQLKDSIKMDTFLNGISKRDRGF